VPAGRVVATLQCCNPGAAFSPDGQTLASGAGFDVALWDVATWQKRATLAGHTGVVYAVQFSPDGKTLASSSQDGTICLWDLPGFTKRAVIERAHPSGWIFSLAFSPDGACLASAGGEYCGYGEAMLWNVATEQQRATLPRGTTCVAFSPDGKTLASGLMGGNIGLWDAATGRLKAEMSGPEKFTRVLAFFPDGKTLAACNYEGSVTLWDTARRQQRATLRKGRSTAYSLAVSPDGRTLATGNSDGEVEFWRAADERDVAAQSSGF